MASYGGQSQGGHEYEPEDKDREKTIKFYLDAFLPYIVHHINWMDLMDYPCDSKMKKKLHFALKTQKVHAVQEMLEYILSDTNDTPKRFGHLVDVLKNNKKVVSILLGQATPRDRSFYESFLQNNMKFLRENLLISQLIPDLLASQLISESEAESLQAIWKAEGNCIAVCDFIFMLPNRLIDWYPRFMMVLVRNKLDEVGEKIDRDCYNDLRNKKDINSDAYLSLEQLTAGTKRKAVDCDIETSYTGQSCKTGNDTELNVMEDSFHHVTNIKNLSPGFGQEDSVLNTSVKVKTSVQNIAESCDIINKELEIQSQVLLYRNEIKCCIKEPSIVAHIAARSVINEIDQSRLTDLFLHDNKMKAADEVIQCVLNSKEPRKWHSFIDALCESEYPYLADLLSSTEQKEVSKKERTLIRLFSPQLEKSLNVHDIASTLCSKGVINNVDMNEIFSCETHRGKTYAVMCLLNCLPTRQAPEVWYYEFLKVLMDKDCEDIVKKIEPDFIDNPSQFMPKLGPIVTNKKADESTCQPLDSSIQEHYMSCSAEGVQTFNNLSTQPPPPPERTDSLLVNDTSEKILLSNLKEMNIKPDVDKALSCGTEDIDSADTDSLASDYEETDDKTCDREMKSKMNLRNYQLELAEDALLGRNTIICSETGSGKTWVALYIVEKHLQTENNGAKKVAFMARTGALIGQQADRFKKYLPQFNTKLVTGEDDEAQMLRMLLDNYDIICFTPQILVNNLTSGNVKSICEFSLLILDECHHTRGDEPYNRLMRNYLIQKGNSPNGLPQIVGLTASIGVGKARSDEEALEHILHVCACLDVRILSTVKRNVAELRQFTNTPSEEAIKMVKPKSNPSRDLLLNSIEDTEEKLTELAIMQPNMVTLLEKLPRDKESQEYNKWTVDVMKTAEQHVENDDVSRNISTCAKYLNIYNSALEVNTLLRTLDVVKYLAEKHRQESEHKAKLTREEKELFDHLMVVQKNLMKSKDETNNPNVLIVSKILKQELNKGTDSRAMVFVKARATCKALADFLKNDFHDLTDVSPLYGKENRGGDEGMTQSAQMEAIEKFREGVCKVLVATSVGAEGIDIPDCNMVLSYNYSGDEITKIQMQGRIRKKGGKAITFGSEQMVEQERLNTYKAAMMHRAMKMFKGLGPKIVDSKVLLYQREEMQKHRFKIEAEKLKKNRKSEDDAEIMCIRCNAFVCYVSDVRMMGHNHMVIDKTFVDRITMKPHARPKTFDGLHKKFKMYCKNCPKDWGIVGEQNGIQCRILKLDSLKFKNMRTTSVDSYKKWIDTPYTIQEITAEDLPKLLG